MRKTLIILYFFVLLVFLYETNSIMTDPLNSRINIEYLAGTSILVEDHCQEDVAIIIADVPIKIELKEYLPFTPFLYSLKNTPSVWRPPK